MRDVSGKEAVLAVVGIAVFFVVTLWIVRFFTA